MKNFNFNPNSYREVYVVLNKLDLYKRIPKEFQDYINANQNVEYKFEFNENAPLYEQIENEETKALLTYLFIKYINTNPIDEENMKKAIIELMKK